MAQTWKASEVYTKKNSKQINKFRIFFKTH